MIKNEDVLGRRFARTNLPLIVTIEPRADIATAGRQFSVSGLNSSHCGGSSRIQHYSYATIGCDCYLLLIPHNFLGGAGQRQ